MTATRNRPVNATALNGSDNIVGTSAELAAASPRAALDPETAKKLGAVRAHVQQNFGKVAMAMMSLPRYRQQSLEDLEHLILTPLIHDRIAIASAAGKGDGGIVGIAIWASVSEEVDQKIRDQIKAGVFPPKLKAEDWRSGDINWLLDVIAPNPKACASVIAHFRRMTKDGGLRLHPVIARLIDIEVLHQMGLEEVTQPSN